VSLVANADWRRRCADFAPPSHSSFAAPRCAALSRSRLPRPGRFECALRAQPISRGWISSRGVPADDAAALSPEHREVLSFNRRSGAEWLQSLEIADNLRSAPVYAGEAARLRGPVGALAPAALPARMRAVALEAATTGMNRLEMRNEKIMLVRLSI